MIKAFYGCTAWVNYGTRAATTVGAYAFYNCSAMTTYGSTSGAVTFTYVGAYAFWNCQGLTGTATENATIAASTAYSIGAFAFAKTNITLFDTTKVNSKANISYGSGCFSSNSLWSISHSISNSYSPIATLIHTSTSSADGGTYKYIYGGYCNEGKGTLVSGDYVPYVYVWAYWGSYWSASSYCSNITSNGGYFNKTLITITSSASAGFTFRAECKLRECDNKHQYL